MTKHVFANNRLLTSVVPWRIRNRLATWWHHRLIPTTLVPLDKLLIGDEGGIRADKFARLVAQPLRPSTRIADSPHAELLRAYDDLGDGVFEKPSFERSKYYLNALANVEIIGHYFDARCAQDVVHGARRFARCYRGETDQGLPLQRGQSRPEDPVRVRPIRDSSCFQIVDGHHRAAIASVRGIRELAVVVGGDPVHTPLQTMLLDVLWLQGRKELYQPISAAELAEQWVLVRKCSDRLEKMKEFLMGGEARTPANSSYLDVGSSYGWFVSKMASLGFDAHGVERDPGAIAVGRAAYGLATEQVTRSDAVSFLRRGVRFDIVSAFSVLHHFVLGNGCVTALDFINALCKCTNKVLFLDTGQEHEEWFGRTLCGWDSDYIESWIRSHTSFRSVHRLGPDQDAVGAFRSNYSRMLFACVK